MSVTAASRYAQADPLPEERPSVVVPRLALPSPTLTVPLDGRVSGTPPKGAQELPVFDLAPNSNSQQSGGGPAVVVRLEPAAPQTRAGLAPQWLPLHPNVEPKVMQLAGQFLATWPSFELDWDGDVKEQMRVALLEGQVQTDRTSMVNAVRSFRPELAQLIRETMPQSRLSHWMSLDAEDDQNRTQTKSGKGSACVIL
jgi:hypothetical protein